MVWFTCGATLAASTDDDAVGTGTEVTGLSSIGLSAVLQAVMANHPAVKGKQAELDAQHFAIGSAKAGRYPSLSGEANNLDDNVDQFTLRVQQPLWAFGKIDRAIQQEQARFAAEEWGLLQVQRQLTEESASAYARLDGIRQRGQVSRININEHEELYQRTERRQKGQLTSEADLRFAHSRLIQAQAKHERISGELQVALVDLLALTQVPIPGPEEKCRCGL
jgi:adhesin transport system outer membrane protein